MTMERRVAARLSGQVVQTADVILAVSVADGPQFTEALTVTSNGVVVDLQEVSAATGTRLHLAHLPKGPFEVRYAATVFGAAPIEPVSILDTIEYLRPSRYCESDTLTPVTVADFGRLDGKQLLDGVSSWVGSQLSYVSGWGRPTDGALQTYLARAGVCRDFAHLVVALMRARNVPARLASVYAPGLHPMDFHAVAEAYVEGAWYAVDATALAPRSSLLRIATGRDAADTAFMTTTSGITELENLTVEAVVNQLPDDDLTRLVQLT